MSQHSTNPDGIYWGDPKMWALAPLQRRALQRGSITPMEARQIYDVGALIARSFWRRVKLGYETLDSQKHRC